MQPSPQNQFSIGVGGGAGEGGGGGGLLILSWPCLLPLYNGYISLRSYHISFNMLFRVSFKRLRKFQRILYLSIARRPHSRETDPLIFTNIDKFRNESKFYFSCVVDFTRTYFKYFALFSIFS